MHLDYRHFITVALVVSLATLPAFSQSLPEAAVWAGFSRATGKRLGTFQATTLSGTRIDASVASGAPALFHVWSSARDPAGEGPSLVASLRIALPDAAIFTVSADPAARVAATISRAGLAKEFAFGDAQALIRALGGPSAPAWIFVAPGGEIVAYRLGALDEGLEAVRALFAAYAGTARKAAPAAAPATPATTNIPAVTPGTPTPAAAPATPATATVSLNAGLTDPSFAQPVELEVVAELNLARTQPRVYADILREYRKFIRGNYFERPGEITVVLNEGARAVDEAIAFLEKQKPLPPLSLSKGLSLAARDHARDQGKTGQTGHTGSDRSTMDQRMERYGQWQRTAGENIAYGGETARDIVIQLIVDDGVASRGHRDNIFNADFLVVGVAFGKHAGYRTVCVQDFAGGYTER